MKITWETATKRKNFKASKNHSLCTAHFEEKWIVKSANRIKLKAGAVPTLFPAFPDYYQQQVLISEYISLFYNLQHIKLSKIRSFLRANIFIYNAIYVLTYSEYSIYNYNFIPLQIKKPRSTKTASSAHSTTSTTDSLNNAAETEKIKVSLNFVH